MATSHWIDRKEILEHKAKDLQLRLRNRFRVVVADRRNRPILAGPDSYSSSTVHRWIHRFSNFRRDLLPSSKVDRKRCDVSKGLDVEEDSTLVRMLQAVAVPVIGNACHVFMNGLNSVRVCGSFSVASNLLGSLFYGIWSGASASSITGETQIKPLLTVSNHVASVDDPFLIAALLPPNVLLHAENIRWTLCASDRCFTNPVTSAFFRCVNVLPVSRGEGIYQKGMDMAISKLNNGGWVHIFPEGSRSRNGGKTVGSAKIGVARLVLDADNIPLVIPFVHTGMQEIMPVGAKVPRIGKEVTVLVGDPIHFDDLLNEANFRDVPRWKLYDAISSRIGQRLQVLKSQVDKISLEQTLIVLPDAERAAGILHQIDWESFGMENYIISSNGLHHSRRESDIRQWSDLPQTMEPSKPASDNRLFRVGFSQEGEIMPRIRSYVNPIELMGFAARGRLVNHGAIESQTKIHIVQPLRAWKQYLEASLCQQWNSC